MTNLKTQMTNSDERGSYLIIYILITIIIGLCLVWLFSGILYHIVDYKEHIRHIDYIIETLDNCTTSPDDYCKTITHSAILELRDYREIL